MRGGPVAPPDSDHIEIRHQIDGGALAVAVCIVGLPVFPSSQSRMPTLVAQEQATFNERIVPRRGHRGQQLLDNRASR
jgi:hypothetical protein